MFYSFSFYISIIDLTKCHWIRKETKTPGGGGQGKGGSVNEWKSHWKYYWNQGTGSNKQERWEKEVENRDYREVADTDNDKVYTVTTGVRDWDTIEVEVIGKRGQNITIIPLNIKMSENEDWGSVRGNNKLETNTSEERTVTGDCNGEDSGRCV